MRVSNLDDVEPFITLDGSEIRELAGRVSLPAVNQSLAEATVPPGGATTEHYHRVTEELYYFTAGRGRLRIDGQERDHLRSFQSPVRGEEIMAITGMGPCREVGYIKWMIEEAILDGIIPNEEEQARQYMMTHLEQWKIDGRTAHFARRG